MNNEFRIWIDCKTIGFTRSQRKMYKVEFSKKSGISLHVIERWYSGRTKPNELIKLAVNTKTKEEVFKIN